MSLEQRLALQTPAPGGDATEDEEPIYVDAVVDLEHDADYGPRRNRAQRRSGVSLERRAQYGVLARREEFRRGSITCRVCSGTVPDGHARICPCCGLQVTKGVLRGSCLLITSGHIVTDVPSI